jgi:hypothetical protein
MEKMTVDEARAATAETSSGRHWSKFVRGKRRAPGEMNKTEAAYAAHLDGQKVLGLVECWWFETVTFKIGKDCRYTPDFLVMLADGTLEVHECKGFWADDAKVKIKVAASMFPFRFVAVKKRAKKDGGGWDQQQF